MRYSWMASSSRPCIADARIRGGPIAPAVQIDCRLACGARFADSVGKGVGASSWDAGAARPRSDEMKGEASDLFVISDLHLGDGGMRDNFEAGKKTPQLRAFIDHVGSEGGELFILGDLFEFWQMSIS